MKMTKLHVNVIGRRWSTIECPSGHLRIRPTACTEILSGTMYRAVLPLRPICPGKYAAWGQKNAIFVRIRIRPHTQLSGVLLAPASALVADAPSHANAPYRE